MQQTFSYIQQHPFSAQAVFSLLCPVREKDWLDGWDYTLIHSVSGLVEQDAVFSTPHHGAHPTTWIVTHHDPEAFQVSFARVTPGEMAVQIRIQVSALGAQASESHIQYQFTPLSEKGTLPAVADFRRDMQFWEKALNHYLATGEKLSLS